MSAELLEISIWFRFTFIITVENIPKLIEVYKKRPWSMRVHEYKSHTSRCGYLLEEQEKIWSVPLLPCILARVDVWTREKKRDTVPQHHSSTHPETPNISHCTNKLSFGTYRFRFENKVRIYILNVMQIRSVHPAYCLYAIFHRFCHLRMYWIRFVNERFRKRHVAALCHS